MFGIKLLVQKLGLKHFLVQFGIQPHYLSFKVLLLLYLLYLQRPILFTFLFNDTIQVADSALPFVPWRQLWIIRVLKVEQMWVILRLPSVGH